MTKQIGRISTFFSGGRDVSGRKNSVSFTRSAEAPDVSVLGDVTRTRLQNSITDTAITANGVFDTSASQVDEWYNQILSTSTVYWGYYPQSASRTYPGKETVAVLTSYDSDTSVDGALAISINVSGCSRILFGNSLGWSQVTDAANASAAFASVDFSGSSASTYCLFRVIEVSGTSFDISASYQESNNDSTFSTIALFTAASTANQVVLSSLTAASRYRRFKYVMRGTSPCAVIQVMSGSYV